MGVADVVHSSEQRPKHLPVRDDAADRDAAEIDPVVAAGAADELGLGRLAFLAPVGARLGQVRQPVVMRRVAVPQPAQLRQRLRRQVIRHGADDLRLRGEFGMGAGPLGDQALDTGRSVVVEPRPRLGRPSDEFGRKERISAVFALEYRPSDDLHFYVDSMYGRREKSPYFASS